MNARKKQIMYLALLITSLRKYLTKSYYMAVLLILTVQFETWRLNSSLDSCVQPQQVRLRNFLALSNNC